MKSKNKEDLKFIELKNLNFHYKKDNPIINNISTNISNYEKTFILGGNGSGKTTLGKLIMGILNPISGSVHISSENVSNMSLGKIGTQIGYLFQNPDKQFFAGTVKDEIGFGLKLKGLEEEEINKKVDELLKLFHLNHLENSFPLKLSQGEKQRLAIAAILVNDIKYLILDEPTTGLDTKRKEILIHVLKKLNDKGVGMTIISHDYEFIEELGDRTIKLHRGEIIYDKRKQGGSKS